MGVLWCGGEDVDFPKGGSLTMSSVPGYYRSGYSKGGINGAGGPVQSKPFAGGGVTSCWLTAQVYAGQVGAYVLNIGLVNSATASTGIWFAGNISTTKVVLYKRDGAGTNTALATETGNSYSGTPVLTRLDAQVISFGATTTINVWWGGTLVITWTGDLTGLGIANLDAVGLWGYASGVNSHISEIIVADEDLRAWPGLVTLALTGAGTTDQWTGVYSTINQATLSDATPNYTNTAAQDQQFNVTDLPTGTFAIKAVKIATRAAISAGSACTKIALGFNSGGSVAVGASQVVTTAYDTIEQLDSTNPVTSAAFAQSEMNALQLNLRSIA